MAALEDTSTALSLDEWLCSVLETGGVDGEVYGGYICGSLSTMSGSDREEIVETIQDILSGCLVSHSPPTSRTREIRTRLLQFRVRNF